MTIISRTDKALIEGLALSETQLINYAFSLSDIKGILCLSNAITSFKQLYLEDRYGKIVFSMCTEYRLFVIELLKNIDEHKKDIAVKEVLVPTIGDVTDEQLFALLRGDSTNE